MAKMEIPKVMRKHMIEEQKEALLMFMEKFGDISSSTFGMAQGRQKKEQLMNELAAILNSYPNGVTRTQKAWLRCWTTAKSKCKNKASVLMRHMRRTGGTHPSDMPPLNPWEERVMGLISVKSISGITPIDSLPANSLPASMMMEESVDLIEAGPSNNSLTWSESVSLLEAPHLKDENHLTDHEYTKTNHEYNGRREEEQQSTNILDPEIKRTRLRRKPQQEQEQQEQQQQIQQQIDDVMNRFVAEENNRGRLLLAEKFLQDQQAVAASTAAGFKEVAAAMKAGFSRVSTAMEVIAASQQQLAESNVALAKQLAEILKK